MLLCYDTKSIFALGGLPTNNKKLRTGLLASLLVTRTLLGAPGLTTRSKDATRSYLGDPISSDLAQWPHRSPARTPPQARGRQARGSAACEKHLYAPFVASCY